MSKKKRDHKKAVMRYRKSRKISTSKSEDFKVEDWFDENIKPKLKDLDSRIMSSQLADDCLIMVKYWWHAFYQNSLSVAQLIGNPSAHYQVAATMRLLLEISADVGFINEHPDNITYIVDAQSNIAKKQKENPKYSYRNAVEDAQAGKLYAYPADSKRKFVKTEDRIIYVYDKKYGGDMLLTIKSAYGLFSMYNHFNPAAVVWEGNKTRATQSLDMALQDNLQMFRFYPLFLNCMVNAVSDLLADDSLKKYDEDKIEKLFDDMKCWRAYDE